MTEPCREHEIADSPLRKWREQFLAAGAERLSGKSERTETDELRQRVAKLERALGRKTIKVEVGIDRGHLRKVRRGGENETERGAVPLTSFKGNKRSLPSKPCARCGREMTWRKAWARSWDEVRYCSQSCRRRTGTNAAPR